jgi:hypothetical protein
MKQGLNLRPHDGALEVACMKNHFVLKRVCITLSSLGLIVAQVDAKPDKEDKGGKGKGKGPEHSQKAQGKGQDKKGKQPQAPRIARFRDEERGEIVAYFNSYQGKGGGLPPGLAMNQRRGKPLPPGWQRKLAPGYRIDDVSWLSFAPVPAEWFPKLRMEPDTRLYHYGDRVVRVYEPRREVLDVIILPGR